MGWNEVAQSTIVEYGAEDNECRLSSGICVMAPSRMFYKKLKRKERTEKHIVKTI